MRAAQSNRDRVHTASLEDLWRPVLKRDVLSEFIEKARGLLELFDIVVKSFHPQSMMHSLNWTPSGEWCSRLGRTRELSESLHREVHIGHVECRRQHNGIGRLLRLNALRHRTAPSHFALADLFGVDSRHIFVVNRFCPLVLQAGLALLMCLVEVNLVKGGYQNKMRERQQHRLEANDRIDFEFRVVMTAS